MPASAPAEIRGEVAYVTGKAKEAANDPEGALAAYAQVPQTSRFWSQATYLSGIVQVERGRLKEGENLFCKVADPKRQDRTTPVFADERFFAVRDLARLALGRVAHEQFRFDDARYYYYLVPRDSDRLAEALYEAATTRYEKKDYEGARELLDDLNALKTHHRYEDEARILDAYIDLALCRFPDADKKLVGFLRAYEPVRDAARRLASSERGTRALLAAARAGADAGGGDAAGASVTPDQLRAVAALVRIDPLYGEVSRKRAVLERESSGLRLASITLGDMQRSLATTGGVRPQLEEKGDPYEKAQDARAAIDGVRRQIDDLEQAKAGADKIDAASQGARRARGSARRGLARRRGRRGRGAGRCGRRTSPSFSATTRRSPPRSRASSTACAPSSAPPRPRSRRTRSAGSTCASRASFAARGSGASSRCSGRSARSRWRLRPSTPAISRRTRSIRSMPRVTCATARSTGRSRATTGPTSSSVARA